jgi:Zn-dependent protease
MAGRTRRGVTVGHVAGIAVVLHPTFFVLIGLALLGGFGAPLAATTTLALIFGSVVFHEVAHSLVATSFGVRVRDIVLLPIGGMSELDRIPDDPRQQAAIAVAGPASSALLGVLAGALCLLTGRALLPLDLVGGSPLHRLAWFNVVLAGFNLLPALPMDGGRLLRAWLSLRMPPADATVRAAAVSWWVAMAMGAAGVWFGDVWLVFIAIFVLFTGQVEALAARPPQARR